MSLIQEWLWEKAGHTCTESSQGGCVALPPISIPATPRMLCHHVSLSDHVLQHADTLGQVLGISESTTHPVSGYTIWSCLWKGESNTKGASGRADIPTESTAWEELFIVSPLEAPYLCSDTSMSQLPSNTHTYPNPFSHLSQRSTCLLACILCLYILLWTWTSLEPWAPPVTSSSLTLTSILPLLPEDQTKGSWQ